MGTLRFSFPLNNRLENRQVNISITIKLPLIYNFFFFFGKCWEESQRHSYEAQRLLFLSVEMWYIYKYNINSYHNYQDREMHICVLFP